jgi:hypothetical protein
LHEEVTIVLTSSSLEEFYRADEIPAEKFQEFEYSISKVSSSGEFSLSVPLMQNKTALDYATLRIDILRNNQLMWK